MKRVLTAVLPIVLLASVARAEDPAAEPASLRGGKVRVYGALRAMMHEGKTGEVVALDAVLPDPDLYALGALADLAGEITIVGGRAYVSVPRGAQEADTKETPGTGVGATLLVAADVPAWQTVTVDHEIAFEDFDQAIGDLAVGMGMDLDARFPFLLEGTFEDLHWHVVDGTRLASGGTSHQDHLAAAAKLTRERTPATLVGFYSRSDQGVFTHMDSITHVHCVVDEPLSTGHVDRVTISAGTTIRFPVADADGAARMEGTPRDR